MIDTMVMIAYNEAIDAEVMEALQKCCVLDNYTKIPAVFGKGAHSGTHMGNDIWPGRNSLLLVGCPRSEAAALLACVRQLRTQLSAEGVKAFLLPVSQVTE